MRDNKFEATLNELELEAWKSLKGVCNGLLGRHKALNCEILVQNMIEAYKNLGCTMSLKVHFLQSHLPYFPEKAAVISDEHGERFHQDIVKIENHHKGKWSPAMPVGLLLNSS